MKKSSRSMVFLLSLLKECVSCALRFKALLLVLGVVVSLAAFGIVVWQVGAKDPVAGGKAGNGPKADRVLRQDPLVPADVDCSKIRERGIDKQENMRAGAIMIHCGEAKGGTPLEDDAGNDAYGGVDVNLITGIETLPTVTQSETFTAVNPDDPNQIVVAYNDSRGRDFGNVSGASVSTDGGTTFTRLTAADGHSPFAGTYGDPVILYNTPSATWFTVWLDGGCGGQGLGGYKSTTPWDPSPASWIHYCVHYGDFDDRESGWADNNPASPFYGTMYVSWNDFGRGAALFVVRSTDNGVTWTDEAQLSVGFIRNVQITGDLNGDVYIAGMDENGGAGCEDGCGTNRNNKIYRSTDGGATWGDQYTGPAFQGPCRSSWGYFCTMYSSPEYWRHMGWGQPAAYNGIVSYVYAARDPGTTPVDPSDVYYIRSTDAGTTFSAPLKLNTDSDPTKAQWQPNLSVSPAGTLLATWYDETPRTGASCQPSSPTTLCYQMYSRRSFDNGSTWVPEDTLSDVVSPLPLQPDPGIIDVYAGDYDYGSAVLTKHVTSWVDGRVALSGSSQQNAFTDRELVGFIVSTTTPACNTIIYTQPTDFIINLSDAADPATVQASDFIVNAVPATGFALSNGNTRITFTYAVSPVVTQGAQTMSIPAGAISRTSDGQGIFAFSCTFRYDALQLAVTTTNPPVGGTFNPPAPGDYQYDVNFNEAVDPASVSTGDLALSGNSASSVTAVTVLAGNTTARFTLHMNFGGSLTASIAAGAVTDPFGHPNTAFSDNYIVGGCPPTASYIWTTGTGATFVPGTTLVPGSSCDDCSNPVTLPFPFVFYGQSFTTVNAVSNGNLQFASANVDGGNACLPWATANYVIMPYWDDLLLTAGRGIFTSISGSAPNRIFNVEWRGYSGSGLIDLEVRLYETTGQIDFIYGTVAQSGSSATVGIQKSNGAAFLDQFACNTGGLSSGFKVTYVPVACANQGRRTAFDYDGDVHADVSVFRPGDGMWYLLGSTNVFTGVLFGNATDRIAPADFDGDGKTDVGVYRPSTATWYWLNSSNGTLSGVQLGAAEDLPTPADYDGDGRTDVSVFRPSNGVWYRLNSGNRSFSAVQFGTNGDKPTIGDYDGDGRADVAVFRPSNGAWYRLNSSNGQFIGVSFGLSTDLITPADFDGDGRTDVAVYRPSTGTWFWLNSSDGNLSAVPFGISADLPVAADFDGDGRADVSVFRPSSGVWYRLNSVNGSFFAVQFGMNTDRPTPAAFRY